MACRMLFKQIIPRLFGLAKYLYTEVAQLIDGCEISKSSATNSIETGERQMKRQGNGGRRKGQSGATPRTITTTAHTQHSELRRQLVAALIIAQPQIAKGYLYERCVDKYLAVMLPAIRAAIASNHKSTALLPNQFFFLQTPLREQIGTTGKGQDYITNVMKAHSSTRLLEIDREGYSYGSRHQLSVARINPLYEDLLMNELLNLRVEAVTTRQQALAHKANTIVPVDVASLQSYVTKTRETLQTTRHGKGYKDQLLKNLMAAMQLQANVKAPDQHSTSPYLHEYWETADSGRVYGQGMSLQRMTKEVRHAALGCCHKYDFKASAFALMAGLATAINPTLNCYALRDYIKNRAVIRQRLGKELGIAEEVVKEIFTALGFGAELKDNTHNAIRGALAKAARQQHDTTERLPHDIYCSLGADEYQRLIANRTFRYIYDELQIVNQTILSYFSDNDLVMDGRHYSDIDAKTGKRRNSRQKLAWIYQALESKAMREFIAYAQHEVLLTTHDCVYFKRKLPASVVVDATYLLQQTYPYLRFEHEAIYPIATDAYYAALHYETDEFERLHKAFIADATKRAELYYGTPCAAAAAIDAALLRYDEHIEELRRVSEGTCYRQTQECLLPTKSFDSALTP